MRRLFVGGACSSPTTTPVPRVRSVIDRDCESLVRIPPSAGGFSCRERADLLEQRQHVLNAQRSATLPSWTRAKTIPSLDTRSRDAGIPISSLSCRPLNV